MTNTFQGLISCSPGPDRIDLFTRTKDGEIFHRTLTSTWGAWKSLGGQGTVAPAVTVSGDGCMELFAIKSKPDESRWELLHRRFNKAQTPPWSEWVSYGRLHTGMLPENALLTAATMGSNLFDLIFLGNDEILWHTRLGGQPLSIIQPPKDIGFPGSRQIVAVSKDPGILELFYRNSGFNKSMFRSTFDGEWHGRQRIDDPPNLLHKNVFGLAATAKLDVFTVGASAQLWHKRLSDTNPTWKMLGGQLGDHLTAVSRGLRSDVFTIWNGVALLHRWFDGEWSDWNVVDIWPGQIHGYKVLRPQDLVALNVHGVGLRERVRDGAVELVPNQADARLIVCFPPQHVGESVISSGSGEPSTIEARLAGPSRLAFTVKANQSVALTIPGVLNAMKQLSLIKTQPTNPPTIPGPNNTAIELPWRLMISPQENTDCSHREQPGTSTDRITELWHTRLLSSNAGGKFNVRPLVALQGDNIATPLKQSLNDIALIGSNPNRQPVTVDRLILSSMGGWLSAAGSWPEVSTFWSHDAAMGRDYFVRVLKGGVLYPFGHHAVYVKVSERSFQRHPTDTQRAGAAALRETSMLIITEHEREYGIGGQREREFPFQHVTIEPRVITPLEEPNYLFIGSLKCFWPVWRGNGSVKFKVRAQVGNDIVELVLPLLFVETSHVGSNDLNQTYGLGPSDIGKPKAFVGKRIPIAMKTKTEPLQGAIQEVHSMTFGGVLFSTSDVGFYPKVTELEVLLPAARQLLGLKDPMPATFSSTYIHAVRAELSDVLLDLKTTKHLPFSSAAERTGALAAPNFPVRQISRKLGPSAGTLIPNQFFKEDAKLLGAIKLLDLLQSISDPPKLIWTEATDVTTPTAEFYWKENLTKTVLPFEPLTNSYIELKVVSTIVDGKPKLNTTGKLTNFNLSLMDIVLLKFDDLCFTTSPGQKPSITFNLKKAELKGRLEFVKKLQCKMQTVGGPHIEVLSDEIKATYRVSVPTLAFGPAFTLQNLALETGLTLSLKNDPARVDFSFGTQDRPFLVTVSMFGGGGYLELGVNANKGLQRFVGGIEFGASVAMDFVIARGEVHVLGGFVFAKHGESVQITGYLRIGGSVQVLGLVRISVELTVSLTYFPGENALIGTARLVVAVDLTFWSTSVELECHQRFNGSALSIAADPCSNSAVEQYASKVEAALGPQGESFPWETYCRAFAWEPPEIVSPKGSSLKNTLRKNENTRPL